MTTAARQIDAAPWWRMALLAAGSMAALMSLGDAIPAYFADKDFANYWIAARLVLSGQSADLFADQPTYFQHMQAAFGPDYPWHAWSYPPHYLLFVWPLGLLDYLAAMGGFLMLTLALYLAAAKAFVGRLDRAVLGVLVPFVAFNIWATQNGFLTAALLLGSLALRYDRPVLSGILAGCLTIKPQLGLLLPILFLIEGRWTVIASAAGAALGLVMLSAAVFGVDSWIGYIENTFAYQSRVMSHGTGIFLTMMPSPFGSMRVMDLSPGSALAIHGLIALPALVASVAGFVLCKDRAARACILIAATFAITPYSLAYDLGTLSAAAAAAMAVAPRNSAFASTTVTAVALLPLIIVPLGLFWWPLAPVAVLAMLALLLHRGVARDELRLHQPVR